MVVIWNRKRLTVKIKKGSRELQQRTNLSWCLPAAKPRKSKSQVRRKLKLKLIKPSNAVSKKPALSNRVGGGESEAMKRKQSTWRERSPIVRIW